MKIKFCKNGLNDNNYAFNSIPGNNVELKKPHPKADIDVIPKTDIETAVSSESAKVAIKSKSGKSSSSSSDSDQSKKSNKKKGFGLGIVHKPDLQFDKSEKVKKSGNVYHGFT